MSEIALELDSVTVSFRTYEDRPTTLKESVLRFIQSGRISSYDTFNALNNISIKIGRGNVVGIIGGNGAGKSTLLKTIAGTIPPTTGRIDVYGRLDSFIQLGAGFDHELSAVENIFLNCSLYKMPRARILERIPHILEFAELHDFAQTPIKYYSSGMCARLGFAVAIERNPDILLVDEILGVGDARFREKCDNFFQDYLDEGKTIVIVSHELEKIQEMSDQIILLSKGTVAYSGDPQTALEIYRDESYESALK